MHQFLEFLRFELKLRFKSPSTYVYFFMWAAFAFLCVASENFGPVSSQSGKVMLNGPWAMGYNMFGACMFGMIVMAAIFGTSILRDFQRDTFQLLFTKPVSRLSYLGGRWSGSMLVTLFAFSGLLVGAWLGTYAPWADHARIGPNHLVWYLQPFFTIVVVQVFFIGALFFAVAALTRSLFVVYVQGVALFVLYLIGITAFQATRSTEHFWSGILDPIGLQLARVVSGYWSVVERNSWLFPMDTTSGYAPGVFLYNRLLWIGFGALVLAALALLFPMSVEALGARSQGRRAAKLRTLEQAQGAPVRTQIATRLPQVHPRHDLATRWRQFLALASLRTRAILKAVPFWALCGVLFAFIVNNGYYAGRMSGTDVWPVTYLMLESVEGNAYLFLIIVTALYAGELVWRERDVRFDGIFDALPLRPLPDAASKLLALTAAQVVMLLLSMLGGVLMQTVLGYYHYEPLLYFKELFVLVLPQLVGFSMLALFVQTVVPNKFLGHAIVIGLWVIVPILYNFGLENTLYLPGATPGFTYSDMNGYGHYVPALFWSILYWLAIFAALGVLSMALARRGAETGLRRRIGAALRRPSGWLPATLACLCVAAAAGGWYYYNTHVLNEFLSSKDRRAIQADYERRFKRYQDLPQPKVTAVDTTVEIYPERRAFEATGTYTLQNRGSVPVTQLHFTDINQSLRALSFDRPAHLVSRAPRGLYVIYALDAPLQPGQTMTLHFKVGHDSPGFTDGKVADFSGGDAGGKFAYNGTFFDLEFFPILGYQPGNELDDPRRRREQGLGPQQEMAKRGDPVQSKVNLFSPNADWISFHTVVGTSGDQTALAPGYLQKQWRKDGRQYFEYSMGQQPMQNFFAFVSGRYAVHKEVYPGKEGPINLEVYYHPGHAWNIGTLLASSRAGMAYNEAHFSPFQFRQYRILEYPRYRSFAQSFPNTVPFSEALGFIQRRRKDDDVDFAYFITTHELGHQWWGHQLIGGNVEGSNMMSETLAEYSALMALKHQYGPDYMRKVLRTELDSYLRGRTRELRRERPLVLVQNEPYVWYNKGGLLMYTLADYMGEDKVNAALRDLLLRRRYANADPADGRDGSYPDTREFVAALRAQAPADLQSFIGDSFERIVLYDNRARSATARKLADGRYQVTLQVQAGKAQADGDGNETPAPMDDLVEVGVFEGAAGKEKPLAVQRVRLGAGQRDFTFTVDRLPTRAGIDPYNKLVDRIAEDNLVDVSLQ